MKKDLKITYTDSPVTTIYRAEGETKAFSLRGSPLDRGWKHHDYDFLNLTDTGNSIIIKIVDQEHPIELDYMQAELLRIALRLNDNTPKLTEIVIQPFSGLE